MGLWVGLVGGVNVHTWNKCLYELRSTFLEKICIAAFKLEVVFADNVL